MNYWPVHSAHMSKVQDKPYAAVNKIYNRYLLCEYVKAPKTHYKTGSINHSSQLSVRYTHKFKFYETVLKYRPTFRILSTIFV